MQLRISRASYMLRIESGETKMADINAEFLKDLHNDLFAVEDDWTYFCMYDDLMGTSVIGVPELPAIADSCYVPREEVFLPPRDSYSSKNLLSRPIWLRKEKR